MDDSWLVTTSHFLVFRRNFILLHHGWLLQLLRVNVHGQYGNVRQVGEIGLYLRLGNVDDFKAVLHKQLHASDSLGAEILTTVVGADFAQHGGDVNVLWQADEQVDDFWRVFFC